MIKKPSILILITLGIFSCAPDPKRIEEADVHFRAANQLLIKGDPIQAMAEGLRAAKLDPKNSEIQNLLGILYIQRNDFDQAEKYFRESVHLQSTYSEGHNHLCALLIEKTKYDQAIKHCMKAVENVTYPTPERAYHNMGIAYERKGDISQAIEAYKRGLVHNKNFVMSLKAYGKLLYDQRSYREAVGVLESAAKVCNEVPKGTWRTECPESFYLLSLTYIALKKRKEAVTALKGCVSADEEKGDYGKKCEANLRIYK